MADGRWQMADGRWRMADGGWQRADGRGQTAEGKDGAGGAISAAAIRAAAIRHLPSAIGAKRLRHPMFTAATHDAVVGLHDAREFGGELLDRGFGAVDAARAGVVFERGADRLHPLRADAAAGAFQRVRRECELVRVRARYGGAQCVEAGRYVLAKCFNESLQ